MEKIEKLEANQTSNVIEEFSRFAYQYDSYNIIQSKVAKELVEKLPEISYKKMIDIGCGSGEVYKNLLRKNIAVEYFVALDASEEMLDIHPNGKNIHKICADFNSDLFLSEVPLAPYNVLISSSALQWSTDLRATLASLANFSSKLHASIFTSGTFKTLHETAGISSPIYATQTLQNAISQYYSSVHFEIRHYRLHFRSTRDMFRYIKQSGVSSGERRLNYRQSKALMKAYPLKYLEFEVLFVKASNEAQR